VNGIGFDDMTVPMLSLVSNSYQIIGSAHNGLEYLAEALNIAASGKVKPMIEVFPGENVNEAAARATAGDVRFRPSSSTSTSRLFPLGRTKGCCRR
jgi:D-arabinose 1-dehydrogenase-like Zn-dependent alcohol dehydrogenase